MEVLTFVKENIVTILAIVASIIAWRKGVFENLLSNFKAQSELYLEQRDESYRKITLLEMEIKELRAETKSLRNDSMQKAEINAEERAKIRELEQELRQLKS